MKTVTTVFCAVLLTVLAGCRGSDRPEMARVRGKVMLDGKPYTQGGTVLFQPDYSAKMATGEIQSDGSYELSTYSPGDGAAVGRHQVMVMPPPTITDESAEGKPMTPAAALLPKKYNSAATSGVAYEVISGEVNNFSIELKSE